MEREGEKKKKKENAMLRFERSFWLQGQDAPGPDLAAALLRAFRFPGGQGPMRHRIGAGPLLPLRRLVRRHLRAPALVAAERRVAPTIVRVAPRASRGARGQSVRG